jgi:hypothetical protein
MSIMSRIGDLMSPNDPELVEKTLTRLAEQDTWNDVFSTKLIELLDNIDLLKSEHREKLRAVGAAAQNASASLEQAERAHNRAAESILEAKETLDESLGQLDRARSCTADAERELRAAEARLHSSDHNLQKARELEHLSEQKHFKAVKLLQTVMRYAIWTVVISWIAMVWVAWLALRPELPAWGAGVTSVVLVIAAVFISRSVEV